MAQQGGRIDFQVGFKTDKSGIEDLKKSLQDLQKIKPMNFEGSKTDLQQIKQTAADVQAALSKAFNPNINSINLKTFDNELKTSHRSIEDIYASFSKAGAQGQVAFSQMARSILTTNQQLKQTHSLINQMGTTMVNTVKWGIASSIMNTFTSSVQGAFTYVESLEKSLTNIRIVTGDSQQKMEQFADSANRAAQELGRSTMDYTKAALTFYQQGLNDQDVQARTEAVLKAQNITGAGSEMADYMTAVWNGYKVANEQAQLYVDKLAAVADSSASDMSQLAIAMSKVASTANAMGVDVDQLNAQIATVVATTRQAPEAVGTAFKTIYTRLNDIKTGADGAEVSLGNYSGKMAELGFNVLDASGHLRDTGQIMQEIGSRWGDLTKEQQIYLATTMGGQRQVNQLMALFENWTTYSDLLNVSLESEGTLAEKNSRYMESLGAKMEKLGAAGERVKASLIDSESFGAVIDLLTTGTNLLGTFIEGIGGGGTALLGLGGIATQVFSGVISKEINNAIVNFQNMKSNAEQIKEEIRLTEEFGNREGYQRKAISEMLEEKRKMQQFYSVMSDEEKRSYNNIVNEIGATKEEIILLQDKVKKGEEFNRALEAAAQIEGSTFDQQQMALVENYDEIIDSIQEYHKVATTNEEKDVFTEGLIDQFDILKKIIGTDVPESFQSFFKEVDRLTAAREKIKQAINVESFKGEAADTGWIEAQEQQIIELDRKIRAAIQDATKEIGQNYTLSLDVDVNTQQLEQARKKIIQLKNETTRLQNQMSQALTVRGVVEGVGQLGRATSAVMALTSSIKGLFDSSVPPMERFGKLLMSIGYSIPTLLSSYSKLATLTRSLSAATVNATTVTQAKKVVDQAQIALDEKKTALNVLIKAQTDGQAVSEATLTAAKETEKLATDQLAASQEALNVAMNANPIGLIVIGIMGLIAAISGAMAIYDHFNMSVEQAGQAIDKFNQKAEETRNNVKEYNVDISNLESAQDEWEKLSKRAGAYNSTIDNLTEAEKERYFELSNLIAQYNDGAVAGYDAQGNAIIGNNDALRETIALLKEKCQLELDDTYDSKEYDDAQKGRKVQYDSAKENKELIQSNIQTTTTDFTNKLEARGRSLSVAFQDLNQKTQEQFAKEAERLDYIMNLGAQGIYDHREELISIFEKFQQNGILPVDYNTASVGELQSLNQYLKNSKDELKDVEKELADYQKVNTQEILEILQTSDYNTFYEQAKNAGITNINGILSGYIQGLSAVDENGEIIDTKTIAQNVNDKFLIPFMTSLGQRGEHGDTLYNNLADSILNDEELKKTDLSFKEKNDHIEEIVQNFLNNNKSKLMTMFEAAQNDPEIEKAFEQMFSNMFNIEGLDIDFNTGKIQGVMNEKVHNITEELTKNITQGLSLDEQASLELPTDELVASLIPSNITDEELDHIRDRIDELALKSDNWREIIKQATSYTLTADNVSQNLNTVNLAGKQNQGENLSKEETQALGQGLEQLRRIYPQLDNAVNILSQDQLAGTAQYQAALQEVNSVLTANTLHAIEMADDGGEAIKTAYTNGLTSAAQAIDAFESGILSSGDKINESLAYTATSLSELDDLLGYGAISGQAFGLALQTVSDAEAQSYGLDVDKYEDYVSLLQATNEEYENNEFLARQVALANERIAKGTEDLIDNWDDWNETLSDYIESGGDILALADDWGELKEAIANTFNMDEKTVDMLGPDFVAQNWDKIQQVKDGVEGAWEELDELMSQTLILNAYGVADFSDLDQKTQDAYNIINDLDGTNVSIVAGMEGTDEILDAFQTIADGAHWTSAQAQAAFSQMGYNVEVQEKPDAMHSQTEETQYYVPPTYVMRQVPFSLGPYGTSGTITYPDISQEAHYESAGGGTKQSYEPGAYSIKSVTSNGKSSGGKISRKTAGNHGGGKSSGGGKKGGGKKGRGKKGGGKKGKSSTPKASKTQKSIKDTQDRYHDVNLKLKDTETQLKKVQQQQDKLTGPELLKNLDKQQKLLDKQVKTYKEKIQLEKQERDEVRNRLAKEGVTFDANGNIANYSTALSKALADYNAVIAKYNKMSAEDQQKNKYLLDNAKERYETIKSDISRYDKIVSEEIPGLEKSIRDAIEKQTQINIEKFKLKVDMELDLAEAERDFNEFRDKVKKQLRDDDILGQAKSSFADLFTYYREGYNVVQGLTDQVQDTIKQINQIDRTGNSSVYGTDRAAAVKDLKDYMEQLMKNLQEVEDLVGDIKESVYDAIDKAQDAFDNQRKEYEQISDLIDHNQKTIEMLYGDDAYKELEKYYQLQEKNNNKELDFLRRQKDMWYNRMTSEQNRMNSLTRGTNEWKEANDRFEEYKEHWIDALNDLNDQMQKSIENIIDKYTNAVDKIFKALENQLTNNKGYDHIEEEWELINKQADMYFDQVNRMYEIDKLENAYQDAIKDNDGNIKAQQSLNNLMNEQLKYLKDKDKLSQYDVDRANALLQIEIKRLALEQQRASKTKLRLRRDAQGNYTYQYTADPEANQQAKQELADAQNSLYNMTKEAYKNNLDSYYDTTTEWQDKVKDVYKDTTLTAEEQQQKIALLNEYYGEIINDLTRDNEDLKKFMMQDTFDEMAKMYDTNVENFQAMADAEKNIIMGDMVPYWKSGIQEMATSISESDEDFIPLVKDTFTELDKAARDYANSLKAIESNTGTSFDQLANGIDKNISKTQALLEANKQLINGYDTEIAKVQDVIDKVQKLMEIYQKAKNEAIAATEAAYRFETMDASRLAANAGKVDATPVNTNKALATANDLTTKSDDQLFNEFTKMLRDIYKYSSSFATGGYTGGWGDDGKIAVLHEKELVLNQKDTENMLSAVQITRTLDNILSNFKVNIDTPAAPAILGSIPSVAENNNSEQYITINADFPAVQNQFEIEAAFDNLVNKASQYAFRTQR